MFYKVDFIDNKTTGKFRFHIQLENQDEKCYIMFKETASLA